MEIYKMKPMYTPKEFCEVFGISRRKLYDYIKSGRLRAIRLGKNYIKLTDKDIDAFFESFKNPTAGI